MKNLWYGDARDVVKWSALLFLAHKYDLSRILQVAYLRDNASKLSVEAGSESVDQDVIKEIIEHFSKDIRQINKLKDSKRVVVEVFDEPFSDKNRRSYTQQIVEKVSSPKYIRALVFLDPDTGIAGKSSSDAHVTLADIRAIWGALARGNWLVVYQHAWHTGDPFGKQRADFKRVVSPAQVMTLKSLDSAKDMVLFAACRP